MGLPRPFRLSLRAKIILLSCGFAAAAAISIIWLNRQGLEELHMVRAREALSSESQSVAIRLEENFVKMAEDARVMALTPPIKGIMRTSANEGHDPHDGSDVDLWRDRLETIFSSMMRERSSYTQIRYIGFDDNGRELVRVNRLGTQIVPVATDALQEKGAEPYMIAAETVRPGESWFSPVTFNRENGEVEITKVPTIRLVYPVFDDSGQRFGAIVINADFEALLSDTLNRMAPNYRTIVVEKDGMAFAYEPTRHSMHFLDDPETAEPYLEIARASKALELIQSDQYLIYDLPVKAIPRTQNLHLDVILEAEKTDVIQGIGMSLTATAGASLLILASFMSLAAIFADRMTRPLRRMTDHIRLYSEFDAADRLKLPTTNSDETGDLARAFTDLVSRLSYSESLTSNVIRNAVYGLIVMDQRGILKTFNPAAEKIFGYRSREVIGKSVAMLMGEEHASRHHVYVENRTTDEKTLILGRGRELKARRKSGDYFTIEISVSEIRQGEDVFFCAFVRDMSAAVRNRQESARQKETLEFALKSANLGFWSWNLQTGQVDFCERSTGFLGYAREEFANNHSNWNRLVDPTQKDEVSKALQDYIAGKSDRFEAEFRMKHRDGHWVWISSHATISRRDDDGNVIEIVGVQRDITERRRHETEVSEQNRQLELAEEVADMGHWSLDTHTGEIHWSEGVYRIHGVTPETHTPDLDSGIQFYHPDDRQRVSECVTAAIAEGKSFEFELRIVRPDGEIRHVMSKGEVLNVLSPSDHQIVFGIFQDITKRVEAEQLLSHSEEKNRTLLENIIDGVVSVDETGRIDSCNPACAKIFGYSLDEMIGMSVDLLIPENLRADYRKEVARYLTSGASDVIGRNVEMVGLRKNGETFAIELAVSPLEISDRQYFTGILRDISERKRMEVMKDEFVSTVNHELRTPLTSIYGSLDLLKAILVGQLDEDAEELLDLAHDGCGRLSNLINDILDLEKIAAGKMDYRLETLSLQSLVKDIVRRHEPLARRFNVRFVTQQMDGDTMVRVDPSRFNQALVNLLSNAAKFSPVDRDVVIRTQLVSDDTVRISVQDFGPGIPEDFKSRIFEKFAQADSSTTRKTPGTGLGLNITRSIIEAFDGTVSFDSEVGVGTTFHFDLPVRDLDVAGGTDEPLRATA